MKHTIFIIMIFMSSLTLKAQDTIILNIEQCREMALQSSYDLQRGDNAIRQAKLTRKAMTTNYFPQAEGAAMVFSTKDISMIESSMGNIDMVMQGAYMCGLVLTQPLFAGGKIVTGHKLTKVGVEAAEETQRMQRAKTIAKVESAYWTYVAVLSKVKLLEDYKNSLEILCEQTDNSVMAGMATNYDQMQVRAAHSNIIYQLKRAQSGASLCRMSLCQMTGINYDSVYLVPDTTIVAATAPSNLIADISNRPEVQLLNLHLKANELQVKMTRGDYLPKLALALGYTWIGNIKVKGGLTLPQFGNIPIDKSIDIDLPSVMLTLSVPITKWWEGSYNIKKAKLEVENSRLDMENNKELLQLEVRQAILNLEESYQLIETAKIAFDAASEQLRVAQNRYDVNVAPLFDLLDAQNKWQQAKSDYIEAKTQFLIYKVEYERVTGILE